MSKKPHPADASAAMTDGIATMARQSVDQAQAAFEKASELAHGNVQMMDAAAGAYKQRLADLQLKAIEITQDNMNAAFEFARRALSVRDLTEGMSLQQDFIKAQAEAMQRQASQLNELSMALAKETVKPVQDSMTKSFANVGKTFGK
jgi:phasin family protein